MVSPPEAAHRDHEEQHERRDGREHDGQQLDRALDSPDRRLHVRAAAFDLPLLDVLDVGARHRQPPVLDLLLVRDHDALGLRVEVGPCLERRDRRVQPRLRLLELLLGRRLGLLRLLQAALLVDPGPRLDDLEGAVARPALPQGDERLVVRELIHRVQQEGDIVEAQVLHAAPAHLEELLAHHVDIGDHDGLNGSGALRRGIPDSGRARSRHAGGEHVGLGIRLVRDVGVDTACRIATAARVATRAACPSRCRSRGAGRTPRWPHRAPSAGRSVPA